MNSDCIEKNKQSNKTETNKNNKTKQKTKKQIQNRKNPKSQKQVMFKKIQSAKKIMIIKHAYIFFFCKKQFQMNKIIKRICL